MNKPKRPYSPPEVAELGDVETMTGSFANNDITDLPEGAEEQPNEGVSA